MIRTQMADGYLPPSASLNPAAVANPCPWCGAELTQEWCDISTPGDPDLVTRGRVTCPTAGCGPRCPVCRGEIGDIHGPNCGDIMAAKPGGLRPATITHEDCGSRYRP